MAFSVTYGLGRGESFGFYISRYVREIFNLQ